MQQNSNIQKQLDSKLYQPIDNEQLITEFDNISKLLTLISKYHSILIIIPNSGIHYSWKEKKRCSKSQIQYLSWLFCENRNWIDQLWYLFNISALNYYIIKKIKFDQNQFRNEWKDDNKLALRTMLLLQDNLKLLSYLQQLKQLQQK